MSLLAVTLTFASVFVLAVVAFFLCFLAFEEPAPGTALDRVFVGLAGTIFLSGVLAIVAGATEVLSLAWGGS